MQKLTLFLIISTEFCERFCYYGLRALLFPFLHNNLSYTVSAAKGLAHAFFFLSFFFAVIFGFVSDVCIGHYTTIVALSIVYVLGTAMLVLSAYTSSILCFVSGLVLVAMGTGGIKPCISVFGGDQATKNSNFFSLFYFSINCGAMVSILTLPIIANTNYTVAFSVPFVLISTAVVLFVSGTRMYTMRAPDPKTYRELKAFLFGKNTRAFYVGHGYGFCPDLCVVAGANEEDGNFNEVVGVHGMGDVVEMNGGSFNEVVGVHRGDMHGIDGGDRRVRLPFSDREDTRIDDTYCPFIAREDTRIDGGDRRVRHPFSDREDMRMDGTYCPFSDKKDVPVINSPSSLSIHPSTHAGMNETNAFSPPSMHPHSTHAGVYEIDVDMRDRAAILKRYETIHRDGHVAGQLVPCETDERMGRNYVHGECSPSADGDAAGMSEVPAFDEYPHNTPSDDLHGINSYSCDENSSECMDEHSVSGHFTTSVMNDSGAFQTMDFSSLDDASLHTIAHKASTSHNVWMSTAEQAPEQANGLSMPGAHAHTYSAHNTITLDHSRSAEHPRKEHRNAVKKDCRQVLQICRLYTPIIFFWTIYDQQATSWTDQAGFLNGNVFGWKIIPSQMQVLNALLTLIFIPLFSHFAFLKARTKMVLGFYLGAVSFFLAAVVEHYKEPGLTVMVQLPQYVLMTAGEVLLSVTGLEYSYSMAPKRFRSVVLAMWLFMAAIGNVLVAFISRMNLFKAEIGSYLFYGCMAVVGSRWLNYEFKRISK